MLTINNKCKSDVFYPFFQGYNKPRAYIAAQGMWIFEHSFIL